MSGLTARWVASASERVLGLTELQARYDEVRSRGTLAEGFLEAGLGKLGVRWEVPEADLARIPRSGPLLVVANHPFGCLEGLVLLSLLRRVRGDVKVLALDTAAPREQEPCQGRASHLLSRVPELHDFLIFVDVFEGRSRMGHNVPGLTRAFRWLASGGVLALFPAGEVAHLGGWPPEIRESKWNPLVARLAVRRRAAARCVGASGWLRTFRPPFSPPRRGPAVRAAASRLLLRKAGSPRTWPRRLTSPPSRRTTSSPCFVSRVGSSTVRAARPAS